MTSMKAIQIREDDDRTLVWEDVDRPTPGPGEVLMKVAASAVNRADLVQRSGSYDPPEGASQILGLEAAGEVVEVGEGVSPKRIGEQVCALLTGGGYGEYVLADEPLLMPIPTGFDMTEAAALPEVFFTAYVNLFMEAKGQPGEWAMLHAGASGVGTAGIQLCEVFGLDTIATASGNKLDFLDDLGATVTLDRRADDFDFVSAAKERTEGRGVDIILDPVGADYLEDNVRALARKGRLVSIGLLSGRAATLPMGPVLVRRLKVIGSVLRSRSLAEKTEIAEALREHVWDRFSTGELRPIIDQTIPMKEANRAHAVIASNETIGKVILEVTD